MVHTFVTKTILDLMHQHFGNGDGSGISIHSRLMVPLEEITLA